jgi:hypothetical protein
MAVRDEEPDHDLGEHVVRGPAGTSIIAQCNMRITPIRSGVQFRCASSGLGRVFVRLFDGCQALSAQGEIGGFTRREIAFSEVFSIEHFAIILYSVNYADCNCSPRSSTPLPGRSSCASLQGQ